MFTSHLVLISSLLLALPVLALAKIGLTAQNFYLQDGSSRNVKLSWNSVSGVTSYFVNRKIGSARYEVIARLHATSYDDYEIPPGPCTYKVEGVAPTAVISNEFTTNPPESNELKNLKSYDNIKLSTLKIRSKIKLGDTYYRYELKTDENGAKEIVESSSPDGYEFSGERAVLTRKQICSSENSGFCKLESLSFIQHPKTSQVVLWTHWEALHGYSKANVAVAFGKPGAGGTWTFVGGFRPLGHDSRDIAFFAHEDGSGYLISSTQMNSAMNIYKLSDDWHKVESLVTTVHKGEYRESPAMIYEDGIYYLFTSKAAGWYPSPGKYISAKKISGPWSESRSIGNLGGFSAQSGRVIKIRSSWLMCANQWKAGDRDSLYRQIVLPITLENGYAAYHFYSSVLYLDDDVKGGVYGVQAGKTLSVGKHVVTPGYAKDHPPSNAVHGINTNAQSFYRPTSVPFTFQIDLGAKYRLTQIELTTLLIGGSETAYKYTIKAGLSAKGPFKKIVDESKNTKVGFVASPLSDPDAVQFVILKVEKVVNMHNGLDGRVGVYEFTIYGGK